MSRSRALLWLGLLALVGVLLAGVLGPNRQLLQLELFWTWSWELPLWGVLLLGVAVGSALGGGLVAVLWLGEWRRRARVERRANQVQIEVNQLRRLLAQPVPPTLGGPRAPAADTRADLREPGDAADVSGNV